MTALMAIPSSVDLSCSGAFMDSSYTITRTLPLQEAKVYPSPQEWESQRREIERLYLDERKSLNQVMEFMARVHGHYGTSKMYKSRITKWGLDKKYVRLKDGKHGGIRRATQPRRLTTILTPTPLSPTQPGIDAHVSPPSIRSPNVPVSFRNYFPAEENQEGEPAIRNLFCARPQRSTALTQISMYDSSMSQGLSQAGHHQTRICQPPSPLPDFRIPEQIFGLIDSYVSGSFDSKKWVRGELGVYLAKDPCESLVADDFHRACRTTTLFFNQSSYAQFQQMLSKSFGMISKLLKTEDPRAMGFLLEPLMLLIRVSLVDVALMLRKFICDMASIILTPAHPWARMWKLLSTTEPNQLESLIHQTWQCTTDAFEGATGRFSKMTVNYQTRLINCVYLDKDPASGVRRLLLLLQECERQCGTANLSYLDILSTLGFNLVALGKFEQAETTSNQLYEHARARPLHTSSFYQLLAMEIAARAHYGLGQHFRAERHLREAMKMVATEQGKADLWTMELTSLLEEWLRKWNRTEEADHLTREIAELSLEYIVLKYR